MKRINNSNFEIMQNIIDEIDFKYEESNNQVQEELFKSWENMMGAKISALSKVSSISNDGVITISCADSFVANELYFEKEKIFSMLKEKSEKLGINIKDIKFNYKEWKENIYE